MGFRLNRTYVLKFSGDMEGAEVKLRATSTATALDIRASQDVPHLVTLLAEHVIEWNLDGPDGKPLPIEAAAIMAGLEEAVLAEILRQWYRAAVGITAPLDSGSTDGEQFPVESIPME